MHAELVEQDRRQQLRTDEAARRGMERCRWLADPLAIAAGELFSNRLYQLKPARDLLQRLGHILTQLRKARPTAAGAARRSVNEDGSRSMSFRPWLARRPLAREGAHARGGPAAVRAANSSSVAVVTSIALLPDYPSS